MSSIHTKLINTFNNINLLTANIKVKKALNNFNNLPLIGGRALFMLPANLLATVYRAAKSGRRALVSSIFTLIGVLTLSLQCDARVIKKHTTVSKSNNIKTAAGLSFNKSVQQIVTDTSLVLSFNTDHILESSYLGNGVQWDPYGVQDISPNAWKKTIQRLDFMKLGFVRMVISPDIYCVTFPDNASPLYRFQNPKTNILFKILDYCQSRGVDVVFGEWNPPAGGNKLIDFKRRQLAFDGIHETDKRWTKMVGDFLQYLIVTKKYTCIKYYNLGNEPNEKGQFIKNYSTWRQSIINLDDQLKSKGLREKIKIVGPDVTGRYDWIDSVVNDKQIDGILDVYDIHCYTSKTQLENGDFQKQMAHLTRKAKNNDPAKLNKPFFIGEAGMLDGWSPKLDQQKLIGTYQYGVWMADYAVQSMQAGQSGISAWDLDDAMHVAHRDTYNAKLNDIQWKEWGFWDSYGVEKGKPELLNLRPWYYTWSLLSKYIPRGSQILKVSNDNVNGIRSCGAKFTINNKTYYTFVVVNSVQAAKDITLSLTGENQKQIFSQFNYFENDMPHNADGLPVRKTVLNAVDLNTGIKFNMPSKGVVFFTTMQ